jgi:hypothetical protein
MKPYTQYFGEFGYELSLVVPYAYYLHVHGLLNHTISVTGTKELYVFSENHFELPVARRFELGSYGNEGPACKDFDYSRWVAPPYRAFFSNLKFSSDKPLLIIHNKYNVEWEGSPVNFISTGALNEIMGILKPKYTIVYIRPFSALTQHQYAEDNSSILHLDDFEMIQHLHPEVILFQHLLTAHSATYSYNRLQFALHANCDRFISVQGGNSYLASYFGGTNIVYAVRGSEVDHNSFEGYYRRFSNCNVLWRNNYDDLIMTVREQFID